MPRLTPDTPLIVFGDDWGRYPSTMQHLFRHIATRYPVIWINALGHRVPELSARDLRRAWDKIARTVMPRTATAPEAQAALGGAAPLAIIKPRVLPWHHHRPVELLNTRSLVTAIRAELSRHGLTERPVVITGTPPSVGVLGRLNERLSVYFCMDDFLNFPTYSARMLAPLEARLLERVDLLVATARSLTETKRPASGEVHHLPQGVNFRHFADPRPEPPELKDLPHPRIGFAGSVSTQCDIELLVRLATANPDAALVLVGPVSLPEPDLARLRLANVHLLGTRPYASLPAYVQHFDVGLIPYVHSKWTVAVDPLKLLEYLAAGVPVVTTRIPEVNKYADLVRIGDTHAEFLEGVRSALAAPRSAEAARGKEGAQRHTWEARAATFEALLESALERRNA